MSKKKRPKGGLHGSLSTKASRRDFLKGTAAGIMTIALAGSEVGCAYESETGSSEGGFASRWPAGVERHWIGPEYWSNPLQDWRIADSRLELIAAGPDRNVHILTRLLGPHQGTLEMSVGVGFSADGDGSAGFFVGVLGPLKEYRNNAIHGTGLKAGLTTDGRLFIGEGEPMPLDQPSEGTAWRLHLVAQPADSGYDLTLSAYDADTNARLGSVSQTATASTRLEGNVALYADFADREGSSMQRGVARVWFRDFNVAGTKLLIHEERGFGPVLFTQYALSGGVLKITAQMPPLGADEDSSLMLLFRDGERWETAAEASIDDLAWTASFRQEQWNASRDVPYRLVYRLHQGDGYETYSYDGTIRKEPLNSDTLVVGVLSCATDPIFPNTHVADGLRRQDPDLLAFTGDQFYEESGGYGVERRRDDVPLSTLDYLRKWYMHGWSFGEVMRDRPTICMPDDHDVFQGNVWGAGGRAAETFDKHNDGGYFMPAEWVNMVQRTQTSHLPDPFDPTPVEQGITVYYTHMLYGRVSFAVLEDRKWKSGPDGLIPAHPGRVDHITDPNLDPRTLDVPGAELLGERQLRFLDEWAADWWGADLKVIVSQTIFAGVANLHGNEFTFLRADLDSNGWPQTPRNEALRRFRKGFAFHVGGDQHLPMVVQYGIDDFDDAGYIFCVPAIATGYPRAFEPRHPPRDGAPASPQYTGQFHDGLGNPFTLHAVANPRTPYSEDLLEGMRDKVSGYGILRINKSQRTFTMEAWPILSNPTNEADQFEGWPITVHMEENYGRAAASYLPTLVFTNIQNPVLQVVDDDGKIVYTLRIIGSRYRPKVFRDGEYSVRVGDDGTWVRTISNLQTVGMDSTDDLQVTV